MDVVLLKNVEKLGSEGAVVRVKSGYARNFLLPRGLAVHATTQQVRGVEETKRQRARKLARLEADAQAFKMKLEQHPLSFKLTLGEDEKAFGSVTAADIVEALGRDGMSIDKHAVLLAQPVKSLGVHEVSVKLHPNVVAVLKVRVTKA